LVKVAARIGGDGSRPVNITWTKKARVLESVVRHDVPA